MSYQTDVVSGKGVYINSEDALKLGITELDYYEYDEDFKTAFPEESKKFEPLIYGFAPNKEVGLILVLKDSEFLADLGVFLKTLDITQPIQDIAEIHTY